MAQLVGQIGLATRSAIINPVEGPSVGCAESGTLGDATVVVLVRGARAKQDSLIIGSLHSCCGRYATAKASEAYGSRLPLRFALGVGGN